ncbi:MAG: cytochrome c [Pseudomonadota bacterium]
MTRHDTFRRAVGAITLALFAAPTLADDAAAPDDATLDMGREVFVELAEPQCAVCHALNDADAAGEIGPNLDELQPTAMQVHAAVTGGVGVMPGYGGVLTEEQMNAVAVYVASVTGADTALEE